MVVRQDGRAIECRGNIIRRFEGGQREPIQEVLGQLRSTFEATGLEFIADNAPGPGVRLRASSE
jgi:hypothetical protein